MHPLSTATILPAQSDLVRSKDTAQPTDAAGVCYLCFVMSGCTVTVTGDVVASPSAATVPPLPTTTAPPTAPPRHEAPRKKQSKQKRSNIDRSATFSAGPLGDIGQPERAPQPVLPPNSAPPDTTDSSTTFTFSSGRCA